MRETSSTHRSSIPDDAAEILEREDEHGYRTYRCVVNGETVGSRTRDEAGRLVWETPLTNGLRNGVERMWERDGSLSFETTYVDNLEHGTAKQWSGGKPIGTYRMDHGTGLDLWRSENGSLAEEQWMKDGHRHGFERWWNEDDRTVWEEGHFRAGVAHGIFRRWNSRGRLRRGYPQYLVNGTRVDKRHYLRACASDPSLSPYRKEDDRPERPLPAEYLAQRDNG